MTSTQKKTLWTRDFSIITIGTVISMLGSSVSGFAIGIMVLDYTASVFLYALFMVAYTLPRLVMPLLAGPYLDSFSRKKVIYTLDFVSAGLFAALFLLLQVDFFNYTLFLVMAMVIGSIDSVYQVAYDSFYPNVVKEKEFLPKAYSISSLIYPFAALMVPVASWAYETVGLAPLFAFNAASFLIAAVMETRIKTDETHIESKKSRSFSELKQDFKEGVVYLRREKGLLAITVYFMFTTLTGQAVGTLILPYFKSDPSLGVQLYTFVMACSLLGRLAGGTFHYFKKFDPKKKFAIALFVYFCTTAIEGVYLFLPVALMMVLQFINGAICVTSFNIRISSTQNYVPDSCRARFNGVFQMATNSGNIIGQLSAGALGEVLDLRLLVVLFMALNMLSILAVMVPGRKHVAKIYNV